MYRQSYKSQYIPEKANLFCEDFISNRHYWEDERKGSAIVSFLSRDTVIPWVGMRMLSKLEIDESKCVGCGICVNECQVQNIVMDKIAIHKNKCEFCMHCGAVCKQGAVHLKGKPDCSIRSAKKGTE